MADTTPDLTDESTRVRIQLDSQWHEFDMPRSDPLQFDAQRAVTLLDAGEAAGLELPYSCCSGVCATCFAQVTSGSVTHIENHILDEEELSRGQILVCQAIPITATLTVTYDLQFLRLDEEVDQ